MNNLTVFPLWAAEALQHGVIGLGEFLKFDIIPDELTQRVKPLVEKQFLRWDDQGKRIPFSPSLNGKDVIGHIQSEELQALVPKEPSSTRDRATWAYICSLPPKFPLIVWWNE